VNLVQLVRSGRAAEERYSLEQYIADVTQLGGITQTYAPDPQGRKTETSESPFKHWVTNGYKRNGVVFACQLARLLLFSEARFQWQRMRGGRPGDLFGTPELALLETPWPNGSTGELLARMIQDVDLAGNAYIRRTAPTASILRAERLRPDWMAIVLGSNPDLLVPEVVGYLYYEGGIQQGKDPVVLARDEVAHWSPIPDPDANYRGMSWLSPVLREVRSDAAATDHKQRFFDNAATPNMVIKFDPKVQAEALERFKEIFNAEHQGAANAYKTLFLGGGADATVVGSSFKEMDLRNVQGAGETRIAAAAGVPPVIVGLSEGLQAATYSNYAQARRRFADMTIRPLWRSCCAALSTVVNVPSATRLWYDDRDVPALQEDEKDAASIEQVKASTIAALVREGFTADSAVAAVMAQDMRLLEHTGRLSVQLKGADDTPTNAEGVNDE
jgi:HK97 family phage portal protein